MNPSTFQFSVFTKPWKLPLPQLGEKIRGFGFDGIELPVRDGFQVEPARIATDLPKAVKELARWNLKIFSIAGPVDEATIAACADSGIPLIRVCVQIPPKRNYLEAITDLQREYDAVVPLLDRHGVTLGVQNHCDRFVANAMGLRHLIGKYDPRHVAAVWDAAHNALCGEEPELAIDIVWSHLKMVNLKNAMWKQKENSATDHATWHSHWVRGHEGLASWPRVADELKSRRWSGPVCLTAEYSDEEKLERNVAGDIAFAKKHFA